MFAASLTYGRFCGLLLYPVCLWVRAWPDWLAWFLASLVPCGKRFGEVVRGLSDGCVGRRGQECAVAMSGVGLAVIGLRTGCGVELQEAGLRAAARMRWTNASMHTDCSDLSAACKQAAQTLLAGGQ